MAKLSFRKGNWITDTTKVADFIERLENCMRSGAMTGNEGAQELLNFVKEKNMYSSNQDHMLEALEYDVQRSEGTDKGQPWN